MSLDSLLNKIGDVYAGSFAPAQSGGPVRSEVSKAVNVPCRLEDLAAGQQGINLSLGVLATHRLFTEYAGNANGDIWDVGGIKLRVIGSQLRRAIGEMPDLYVLNLQEISD